MFNTTENKFLLAACVLSLVPTLTALVWAPQQLMLVRLNQSPLSYSIPPLFFAFVPSIVSLCIFAKLFGKRQLLLVASVLLFLAYLAVAYFVTYTYWSPQYFFD